MPTSGTTATRRMISSPTSLLVAEVIDDRLTAVPRGVMAAAAIMQGSRGGVDIAHDDIDRGKSHLGRYYAKMDDTSPWGRD
jgi:hypothetical protein